MTRLLWHRLTGTQSSANFTGGFSFDEPAATFTSTHGRRIDLPTDHCLVLRHFGVVFTPNGGENVNYVRLYWGNRFMQPVTANDCLLAMDFTPAAANAPKGVCYYSDGLMVGPGDFLGVLAVKNAAVQNFTGTLWVQGLVRPIAPIQV
jgi:hypothetical protein